jgi:hypothetical protein
LLREFFAAGCAALESGESDNFAGKPKEPSRHTEWMPAQSFHARISNLIAVVNLEKRANPTRG